MPFAGAAGQGLILSWVRAGEAKPGKPCYAEVMRLTLRACSAPTNPASRATSVTGDAFRAPGKARS